MIKEFINIQDITLEEFYDSSLNESFHAHNDEVILMNDEGKIGFELTVIPTNSKAGEPKKCILWEDSFGAALEKFNIIVGTAIMNITTNFFEPSVSPVILAFFREFRMKLPLEKLSESDEQCDIYYQKVFQNAKSADEIIESFDNFEDNISE